MGMAPCLNVSHWNALRDRGVTDTEIGTLFMSRQIISVIATLSAGYADGLPRTLSNRARLWDGDTPVPLIGRVSMDLITADITDLPQVPRHLDILGPHQGVDQLADVAGTIGYEILTSLGPRYARRYLEQRHGVSG